MLRDFFLGAVKIHILYHASKEEIYGTEIMEELTRHGYEISPGTLYPTLHSLEDGKLLESVRRTVNGKVRRYYHITDTGQKALEEARLKIRELMHEIIYEEIPKKV